MLSIISIPGERIVLEPEILWRGKYMKLEQVVETCCIGQVLNVELVLYSEKEKIPSGKGGSRLEF